MSMPKKRKRCTEPELFCDACLYLDSIGGLGNDSASTRIRSIAKQKDKTICCTGHRDVANNNAPSGQCWDHTVWTCSPTYSGATWDGLKEDCRILQCHPNMIQVWQIDIALFTYRAHNTQYFYVSSCAKLTFRFSLEME